MLKSLRVALLIVLVFGPIIFYKNLNKRNNRSLLVNSGHAAIKPQMAIVFDDLGESLSELKEVYSLNTPLTVAVIPTLKFSKNIAHIASRCGLSVLIHLPFQPKNDSLAKTDKYRFINGDLSKREVVTLLKRYLNSIRIAVGVNNHMGSEATENPALMEVVLKEVKSRNLAFIDSRTSLESVAYKIAKAEDMVCGYNEGFLDSINDSKEIEGRLNMLVKKAKEKGKIIVIAHPHKNTIEILKKKLPALKKELDFITIKDYFDL